MDTLTVAFALGLGEGLDGLRSNLQGAYDQYWSDFAGSSVPYITGYSPVQDSLNFYQGENCIFRVKAVDKHNNDLLYTWQIDNYYSALRDSFHLIDATKMDLGSHTVVVEVANERFRESHTWHIQVLAAKKYTLKQNYPNPFNNQTKIPFELASAEAVKLRIYDLRGRLIWEYQRSFEFGEHEIIWDGRDLNGKYPASGIYFYQLKAGSFIQTKRLLYLR
jgi:hypothetical protein